MIAHASGWHAAAAGALLGLSLAAPPGPVMAIMANAAMHGRVREGILTALGAISADFTWLLFAVLGAVTLLAAHPHWVGGIGLAGAALLVWMAWTALREARAGVHGGRRHGSWKLGYMTVLTSPFSVAWWLANGTLLYTSWGLPGIAGMFFSLLLYSVAYCYAFRWLGARAASAVVGVAYASVLLLGGFGAYVAWESLGLIRT